MTYETLLIETKQLMIFKIGEEFEWEDKTYIAKEIIKCHNLAFSAGIRVVLKAKRVK